MESFRGGQIVFDTGERLPVSLSSQRGPCRGGMAIVLMNAFGVAASSLPVSNLISASADGHTQVTLGITLGGNQPRELSLSGPVLFGQFTAD